MLNQDALDIIAKKLKLRCPNKEVVRGFWAIIPSNYLDSVEFL